MNKTHPSHYSDNAITLEAIDLFPFFKSACVANFFKYVVRYKDKNQPTEDLQKAVYYYKYMIKYEDYADPSCQNLLALFCLKSSNDLLEVPSVLNLTVGEILARIYENVVDKLELIGEPDESSKNCG